MTQRALVISVSAENKNNTNGNSIFIHKKEIFMKMEDKQKRLKVFTIHEETINKSVLDHKKILQEKLVVITKLKCENKVFKKQKQEQDEKFKQKELNTKHLKADISNIKTGIENQKKSNISLVELASQKEIGLMNVRKADDYSEERKRVGSFMNNVFSNNK